MPANSDAGIYAFPADLMNENQSHYILFDIFSEEAASLGGGTRNGTVAQNSSIQQVRQEKTDLSRERVQQGEPLPGDLRVLMFEMNEDDGQERVVLRVQVHQSQTTRMKLSRILE